jgi:hypothetical protein
MGTEKFGLAQIDPFEAFQVKRLALRLAQFHYLRMKAEL